jgi:hypothetical protein
METTFKVEVQSLNDVKLDELHNDYRNCLTSGSLVDRRLEITPTIYLKSGEKLLPKVGKVDESLYAHEGTTTTRGESIMEALGNRFTLDDVAFVIEYVIEYEDVAGRETSTEYRWKVLASSHWEEAAKEFVEGIAARAAASLFLWKDISFSEFRAILSLN